MELKLLSDEERLLFEKDAFADVPPLVTAQGETHPVEERGDCFFQLTNYVNIEEYHAYLQTVESAGWQLIVRYDGIPIPADNITLFRKDRRLLEVIYYDFQNHAFLNPKLYVSVSLVPPYRIREPGDLFRDVALPEAQPARDCGEGNFIALTENAARSEYDALLAAVCRDGWGKQYDNGAGLADAVFTALFTKDTRTLCALYTAPSHRLYVTVGEEQAPPSPYLTDDPARRGGFVPGLRTSLHMLELWHFGNSFVIQLNNGHFLVSDGGLRQDVPYLVDYLEQLAPAGEKPVIEAWFISHAHDDHMGIFKALFTNKEQLDRIYVENVYFNDMGADAAKFHDQFETASALLNYVRGVPAVMHSTDGGHPGIYELSVGDRYYFNDFNVEVVCSAEVLADYTTWGDQNGTSTWLMYNIEGQKVLISADGNFEDQQAVMAIYDRSYLNLTMFSTPHHGYDMFDQFTDYLDSLQTLLYTNPLKWLAGSGIESGSSTHTPMLEHINEISQESYAFGEGTVVYEFPYEVGTATVLPEREWIYNVTAPSWKWD